MSRYRNVRVGAAAMRRRFREAGLEDPEANGYTVLPMGRGPSGPGGPPDCVEEEMLMYLDAQGNEKARAHVFYRADGSLGASGRPDPERLLDGRVRYLRGDKRRNAPQRE